MRGFKLVVVAAIGLAGCGGARSDRLAPEVAGARATTGPVVMQGPVDLTTLDRDMVGPRAQVLVLGTVHLSGMPKGFKPESLDPVLDRLAAFKPDIITIEALSGEECDLAARHSGVYGADYCRDTNAAKAATGLDVPAAIAEVHKALEAWPAQPTPVQRRRLAALFLAANDRASAYVQWLQLPEAKRRAGDGLDEALVAMLEEVATRNNENYQVAARLAARLGLQRLHAVDNHTGDNIDVADVQAFGQALQQAWDAGGAEFNAREKQEQVLSQGSDLLPLYRYINHPDYLGAHADVNVGAPMREQSPAGGRRDGEPGARPGGARLVHGRRHGPYLQALPTIAAATAPRTATAASTPAGRAAPAVLPVARPPRAMGPAPTPSTPATARPTVRRARTRPGAPAEHAGPVRWRATAAHASSSTSSATAPPTARAARTKPANAPTARPAREHWRGSARSAAPRCRGTRSTSPLVSWHAPG